MAKALAMAVRQDEASELVLPAKLDEGDTGYHLSVVAQVTEAQAAIRSWAKYLGPKYRLGEKDRVNDDGTIVRG